MKKSDVCKKCGGTGFYMYDENHRTVCDECCAHPDGWCKMEKSYGNDNGKYACKKGCGKVINKLPDKTDDEALMELTRQALSDVLGRDPTQQEVLRAHAGFQRMAFVMMEHLERSQKDKK